MGLACQGNNLTCGELTFKGRENHLGLDARLPARHNRAGKPSVGTKPAGEISGKIGGRESPGDDAPRFNLLDPGGQTE